MPALAMVTRRGVLSQAQDSPPFCCFPRHLGTRLTRFEKL